MLNISNVSLHSFCVALRWATMFGKFPSNVLEWTEQQNKQLQSIAEECDRRSKKHNNVIVRFSQLN